MRAVGPISESVIESECQRLGHKLGWRLFTCPMQNIETAVVAMIAINPGGDTFEPPVWSVETGSAYVVESWKGRSPGQETLQRQVRRMFEIMNVRPEEVLSGYLVPFRSRRWKYLSRKSDSVRFGIKIWREILRKSKVQTIVAFGKDIAPLIIPLLDATPRTTHATGWGEQTIELYSFGADCRLWCCLTYRRLSCFLEGSTRTHLVRC